MTAPACDMTAECSSVVTHLDDGGYVYCERHGAQRQQYSRCRKLRLAELRRLERGEQIARY